MTQFEDGHMIEIVRRESGEYVGGMGITSQAPRIAALIASGQTRTLCIDNKEFEGMLRLRPESSLAVMRDLFDRLRERSKNIE